MSSATAQQLLWLGLLYAGWAALHSLLLWEPLRGRLESALSLSRNAYRAYYSLLALVSLVVLSWWTCRLGGLWPFFWPWPWLALQAVLWALSLALGGWAWLSFRKGGLDLMGWQGGAAGHHEPPHLVTGGAYAWSRHPMYLASLVWLWARYVSAPDLVVNGVLSLYLFLGAWHEETRLRRAFGGQYRAYARRVPAGLGLGGPRP
ncbi:hypothetical protein AAU61_00815 [Desulfocarbo indianensis]|nr:hypothetical protein AAU61_00815 [Desulfocarbo indianensis]